MTSQVEQLVRSFDELSALEQQYVAAEIIRRTALGGEIPDLALQQLADELFQQYDAEECGSFLQQEQID